jgi:hypothetical protein
MSRGGQYMCNSNFMLYSLIYSSIEESLLQSIKIGVQEKYEPQHIDITLKISLMSLKHYK